MADETVKIKDSKTGKIISATKTKSGYTKGGRTVRLSSTQKEYTPGTPVKPKKKSPAAKKVKGADMNVPAEKLNYIQSSNTPTMMNKYDKSMMHERELIYDAKEAIHRIDKQKHKYDNAPAKMYGKAPSKKYGAPTMKKGGCSMSKHMKSK